MKTPENLRTPDLEMEEKGAVINKAKASADWLKEDVEFTKLNDRYKQLVHRSYTLLNRYEKVLRKNIYSIIPTPTIVMVYKWWLRVNEKEKKSSYTLYWYKWLSCPNRGKFEYRNDDSELSKMPKLVVHWKEKRKEYKLDKEQYRTMLDKIEKVLNREEQQIKELEKKKGGGVDDVINKL